MANRSYFIVTTSREPFPTLRKSQSKTKKSKSKSKTKTKTSFDVIACGEWGLPLLWLALFRSDDLVEWRPDNGPKFPLRAPVTARRGVGKRLREAGDLLERAIKKIDWRAHLKLLQAAIDSANPDLKYVTIEWQEIAALDPRMFYSQVEWLLKFFSGAKVKKGAAQRQEER